MRVVGIDITNYKFLGVKYNLFYNMFDNKHNELAYEALKNL